MSCIIDSRVRGFTLVELMSVIALIAVVLAMSGTSLLDQLRAQQIANAINQGRDIATIIEQFRPAIRKDHTVFLNNTSSANAVYTETLTQFMSHMSTEATLRDGFLRDISTSENIVGSVSGSAYSITLTEKATFVTLRLDNKYADFDFFSTAKPSSSSARWTVTSRVASPMSNEYRYIHMLNRSD